MAVPALVHRLRAGILLTVAALGLVLVPAVLAAMAILIAVAAPVPAALVAVGAVAVALVLVGPVAGVLARVTPAPSGGTRGSRVGANAVARHDGGVITPTGAAMAHDRRTPGVLVDGDNDTPVRGSQRDLPHRAVVHIVGLDLDGPAVRNLGLGDPHRLCPGDELVHRGRGRPGSLVRRGGLVRRARGRRGQAGHHDGGGGRRPCPDGETE